MKLQKRLTIMLLAALLWALASCSLFENPELKEYEYTDEPLPGVTFEALEDSASYYEFEKYVLPDVINELRVSDHHYDFTEESTMFLSIRGDLEEQVKSIVLNANFPKSDAALTPELRQEMIGKTQIVIVSLIELSQPDHDTREVVAHYKKVFEKKSGEFVEKYDLNGIVYELVASDEHYNFHIRTGK